MSLMERSWEQGSDIVWPDGEIVASSSARMLRQLRAYLMKEEKLEERGMALRMWLEQKSQPSKDDWHF